MNYAEFKVIKDKLERTSKILSCVPVFIFLAIIFQLVLLLVKADTNATWFNFILLDQLFSNAKVAFNAGNIILSILFYGGVALCLIIVGLCAFFCFKNIKGAYIAFMFVYTADFMLALLTMDYIQIIVHFVFLCSMFTSIRILNHLAVIPKEVWGYGE